MVNGHLNYVSWLTGKVILYPAGGYFATSHPSVTTDLEAAYIRRGLIGPCLSRAAKKFTMAILKTIFRLADGPRAVLWDMREKQRGRPTEATSQCHDDSLNRKRGLPLFTP